MNGAGQGDLYAGLWLLIVSLLLVSIVVPVAVAVRHRFEVRRWHRAQARWQQEVREGGRRAA